MAMCLPAGKDAPSALVHGMITIFVAAISAATSSSSAGSTVSSYQTIVQPCSCEWTSSPSSGRSAETYSDLVISGH